MTVLQVTIDREIRFISSPDLPGPFRRALATDNTMANPLAGKRGAPPTVECYYHNPFTREVALHRSYWPQFVARAAEFDVQLQVVEILDEPPAPSMERKVAVDVRDLAYGLECLRVMLSAGMPTDWEFINIQVRVTRYTPMSQEAQDGEAPRPQVKLEIKPFPWEVEQTDEPQS